MDNTNKAEQLAKDKIKEMAAEADKVESTEAKPEDKSKDKPKDESKGKKTEGNEEILVKAEKQAEDDARVLSTKEEELSEDDKKRKDELVKAKEAKETPEDKIKRTQEATQRRIDEVISELKAERSERQKDNEKIIELEAKLDKLAEPKEEETKASKIKQLVGEKITTYLEEDKSKSREERREMSKDELEEWLLEDYVEATEWLTDRNIRRNQDKQDITQTFDNIPKQQAEEFIQKQQESLKKLIAKYPNVIPSSDRIAELKGKTKDEIDEIIASENEDYKAMLEIVNSDKKKYLESVDGPEQVMIEMERRKGPNKKVITLTEDELNQKVKEAALVEVQRLSNLDEGITSSGGKKVVEEKKKSEFRQKQEEIARRAGISVEKLDEAIKRRETIGVIASTAEDFNKDERTN